MSQSEPSIPSVLFEALSTDGAFVLNISIKVIENRISFITFVETKQIDMTSQAFERVVTLVKSGLTIQQAIKKEGISKATFYRNITVPQKAELDRIKLLNQKSIHSNGKGFSRFDSDLLSDY